MSADIIIQYLVFLIVLVIFSIPLSTYMAKVMNGEHVFLSKILSPIENLIYKIIGVKKDEEMTWKTYIFFNVFRINCHLIHRILML